MAVAFVIHPDDTVATLLDDAEAGAEVTIRGEGANRLVRLVEPIHEGHKVALRGMEPEEPVVKYGAIIGLASTRIEVGAWVHLHNCRSRLDERSGTLDVETGASTDVRYE